MKIGILTLPLHSNYGGNLQAWALMTVLKRMGHEVVLINRGTNTQSAWKFPLIIGKRFVQHYLLGKKGIPLLLSTEKKVVEKHSSQFIAAHIQPQTRYFSSSNDLRQGIDEYELDAIVVGSDQVWRPQYTPNIEDYFLGFLDDASPIKRISYAASFGTDEWLFTPVQTTTCGSLLQKFNAISVREDSGVQLCRDKFNTYAVHVLDPTMLLNKEDYLDLLPEGRYSDPQRRGVLAYILDMTPEKQEVLDSAAGEHGLPVFHVNSKTEDKSAPLRERVAPPVEDWLRGFRDAQFVVTDSFHACVFSILFNKPFLVVGNPMRGLARFKSLLRMFQLEHRMFVSGVSDLAEDSTAPLNWDELNEILRLRREMSLEFIRSTFHAGGK